MSTHQTTPLPPTYDAFINTHRIQLIHFKVPECLWLKLYNKLINYVFDSGEYFQFQQVNTTSNNDNDNDNDIIELVVFNINKLVKEDEIFLIDHAWTFPSKKEALHQLNNNENLLYRMADLMSISKDETDLADKIIRKLYKYGWQYEFVGNSINEDVSSFDRQVYYYVLDELGSRFTEREDPNFSIVPLFYENEQLAYSLCWPIKDIEEGEQCFIAPKLPLNDFPYMEYWDKRYQVETENYEFDWYLGFDELKNFLCYPRIVEDMTFEQILKPDSHILIPGCAASLYKAGYTSVVNFDYSPTCITQMINKYGDSCPTMSWLLADVTDLSRWEDDTYDVIIDKGCVDAMFDGNMIETAEKGLKEMHRVLKTSGIFILITLGNPDMRQPYIESSGFLIEMYLKMNTKKEYDENGLKKIVNSYAHIYVGRKK